MRKNEYLKRKREIREYDMATKRKPTETQTPLPNLAPVTVPIVPVTAVTAVLPPDTLAVVRATGTDTSATVIAEARAVSVIDARTYQSADLALFKIRSARKTIANMIEEKIDVIIKPIRAGLDKLYEAKRNLIAELDTPLEQAERSVKSKMGAWQEEQRRLREQEEEQRRQKERELALEQQRQQQEANRLAAQGKLEAAQRAQDAATSAAYERERVKEAAPVTPAPVKGAGSKVTVVRRPVVKDMSALLAGIVVGTVPEILVQVREDVMETYWASDRGIVLSWPGVEMVTESKVSGR